MNFPYLLQNLSDNQNSLCVIGRVTHKCNKAHFNGRKRQHNIYIKYYPVKIELMCSKSRTRVINC